MRRFFRGSWYVLISGLALYGSGVIPAIIPAAVPAASRQGAATGKFQVASGSAPTAGDCATWDSSLNLVDSGIATCGGAGTAVNSWNGATGAVTFTTQAAGVNLTNRLKLNFGSGLTAVDNAGTGATDVTAVTSTGALLSGASDPATPSVTPVQSKAVLNTSITYTSSVTSGHLLAVCIAVDSSSSNAVVSDTLTNTYVQLGSVAAATKRAQIWATISGSSGADTISASVSGGTFQVMAATEFSGDVTSTFDAQASGAGAPAAITTVTPSDIVFTCGANNGGFAFTTGGQTTILANLNNGSGSIVLGYQIVASPSTITSDLNSGASIYASRAVRPASVVSPGNNGDWYINLTTGILWGPKAAGIWGHSGWKWSAE
jgi:hypothetical protein